MQGPLYCTRQTSLNQKFRFLLPILFYKNAYKKSSKMTEKGVVEYVWSPSECPNQYAQYTTVKTCQKGYSKGHCQGGESGKRKFHGCVTQNQHTVSTAAHREIKDKSDTTVLGGPPPKWVQGTTWER
jgi:hypothetical protein